MVSWVRALVMRDEFKTWISGIFCSSYLWIALGECRAALAVCSALGYILGWSSV